MEIKTIVATANAYSNNTVNYTYDQLARLIAAVSEQRTYAYQYDVAGNRTQEQVTLGMTTTTTNWTYNAANQIATQQIGANPATNFSYDNNGNLLHDGVLTYTYNRADRLTTVNNGSTNTHYAYDGDHNRRTKTIGTDVTRYLLDLQPGLALVLSETLGTNTTRYMHSPMGIHAAVIGDAWHTYGQDGLGSVRQQQPLWVWGWRGGGLPGQIPYRSLSRLRQYLRSLRYREHHPVKTLYGLCLFGRSCHMVIVVPLVRNSMISIMVYRRL